MAAPPVFNGGTVLTQNNVPGLPTAQPGWVDPGAGQVTTGAGLPVPPPVPGNGGSRTDANNDGIDDVTGQPLGGGVTIGQGMPPGTGTAGGGNSQFLDLLNQLLHQQAGVGAGGTSPLVPFGPGNDLIAQQINPYANPRLQGTQSAVDAAAAALQGPDRFQIAQSQFDNFARSTDPEYQLAIRDAARAAAATGGLKSGMLRTSYGDLADRRLRLLDQSRTGFLNDALTGTIQDRRNTLSDLSGLEGQQYAQGTNDANSLRGERAYQYGLSQDAQTNALRDRSFQEDLLNSQFGRQQQTINALLGIAYGNNPSGTQLQGAGIAGNNASTATQALSGLFGGLGAQSGGTGSSTDWLTQYLQSLGQGAPAPVQATGPNGWGGSAG